MISVAKITFVIYLTNVKLLVIKYVIVRDFYLKMKQYIQLCLPCHKFQIYCPIRELLLEILLI